MALRCAILYLIYALSSLHSASGKPEDKSNGKKNSTVERKEEQLEEQSAFNYTYLDFMKSELISCPQGWTHHTSKCYKHFSKVKTWQSAEEACNVSEVRLTNERQVTNRTDQ